MNTPAWNISRRRVTALLGTGLLGGAIGGCGGSSSGGDTNIRLVNASKGYASFDLFLDGTLETSGITYGTAGAYVGTAAGNHAVGIAPNGSTTPVLTQIRSPSKDVPMTVIAYGWQGSLKAFVLNDNQAAAAANQAGVLVYHAAPDAGNIDIYLSGLSGNVSTATPLAYAVSPNNSAANGYVSVAAGTYRLWVTVAGATSEVLLDTGATHGLTLSSTEVASLVITATAGGILVNGLLIVQGGAVTALDNTQAQVRVVAAVSNNGLVAGNIDGTNATSFSLTAASIGTYALVTAGNVAPSITVNGSTLAAPGTLQAGNNYTLLIRGPVGAPTYTWIIDDDRLPSVATNARVRVLNGLSDAAPPSVTMTANLAVIANGVAPGAASAFAELAAGTLSELGVSSSSGNLYEATNTIVNTLAANKSYTLFMLGSTAAVRAVLAFEH